jgi:acyl dehydratase
MARSDLMTDPRTFLGEQYGPMDPTTIDADHAAAFALATNDPQAAYLDDGYVPPLMTVGLIWNLYGEANRNASKAWTVRDAQGGVHGSHNVEVVRPLRADETITAVAGAYQASNTPAGAQTTQRIVLLDEAGEPVGWHDWTSIALKATVDEVGPALSDHTLPADARERSLGTETMFVARDQSFRYAGVSGDHAPMHVSDVAARRMNWPGKFIQGMCTVAMSSGAAVRIAGAHPGQIARVAARLSSPVFPGNDLTVEAFDIGTGEDGLRQVGFEATLAGGATVIKHGRLVLRPA